MNEQTVELVREVLRSVGDVGSYTYQAALKYIAACAVVNTIVFLLLVLVSLLLLLWGRALYKQQKGEEYDRFASNNWGMPFVIAGVLLLFSILPLSFAVPQTLAPEWCAIEKVAVTVLPSPE